MASPGDDRQRPIHGNAGVRNNGPSVAAAAEDIPQIVYALSPNDVLMGRGTPISNNVGNMRFRDLIRTRKEEYLSHWRHQIKHNIARQVHAEIISRKGKFLRPMDSLPRRRRVGIPDGVKAWEVVGEDACLEKIKQALRGKDTLPTGGAPLDDAALAHANQQAPPNGLGLSAIPSAAGADGNNVGNTLLAFGAAGAASASIGTAAVPPGGTANAAGPPSFQLNPQLLPPPAGQTQGQSAPQLQQQIDTLYMSLLQQQQQQQQQQQIPQQQQLFFPPFAPPAPAAALAVSAPVSLTSDNAVREQLVQMILSDPNMLNLLLTRLQASTGAPPPPPPPQPMLSTSQSPISALQALLQQASNSNPPPFLPPAASISSNNSSADPQQFIANAVSAFLQSQSSGQLSQPSLNNQVAALFPSLAAPPQQPQGTSNTAATTPSLGNLAAALGGSQFPLGPLATLAQQYHINLVNAAAASQGGNSSSVLAAQSSGTAAASPPMTSFWTGNSADLAALQGQALHSPQAASDGVLSPGQGTRIVPSTKTPPPVVMLALPSRTPSSSSNAASPTARAPAAAATSAATPRAATTATAKPQESSSSYETGSSGSSTNSSDDKPKNKRSRTSPA
jgi:hypothetical protein